MPEVDMVDDSQAVCEEEQHEEPQEEEEEDVPLDEAFGPEFKTVNEKEALQNIIVAFKEQGYEYVHQLSDFPDGKEEGSNLLESFGIKQDLFRRKILNVIKQIKYSDIRPFLSLLGCS
jgi:hypothetical protein